MVIQIETAQNGFVVRDTKLDEATPIIVENFNNLVGVLVQAFNIQVEKEGAEGTEDTTTDVATTEDSSVMADEAVELESV